MNKQAYRIGFEEACIANNVDPNALLKEAQVGKLIGEGAKLVGEGAKAVGKTVGKGAGKVGRTARKLTRGANVYSKLTKGKRRYMQSRNNYQKFKKLAPLQSRVGKAIQDESKSLKYLRQAGKSESRPANFTSQAARRARHAGGIGGKLYNLGQKAPKVDSFLRTNTGSVVQALAAAGLTGAAGYGATKGIQAMIPEQAPPPEPTLLDQIRERIGL